MSLICSEQMSEEGVQLPPEDVEPELEGAQPDADEWKHPEKKRSEVWKHFLVHPTIKKYKCTHCKVQLSGQSSTTTVAKHIKKCEKAPPLIQQSFWESTDGATPSPSDKKNPNALILAMPEATLEELVIGRMVALRNNPIFRLSKCIDTREGDFSFNLTFIIRLFYPAILSG